MRERAHRYIVGAGRGQFAEPFQRHPARDLDLGAAARAADGLADLLGAEIVHEHDIGAGRKRLVYLSETLCFDLDGKIRLTTPHSGNRGADTACEADMIVLDQDRVEEAHAV